jgi:hypothetical protein
MPPGKRDRSEDINQLLLEFDSDDEPQVEAVQGSGKGSSSRGSATRAKAAVADVERNESVQLRIALLRRLKGGFPAFEDENPDPGCSYEVTRCSALFDPFSCNDDDQGLSVSTAAMIDTQT